MQIENIVLNALIHDENYMRQVLPFIKAEYFSSGAEKVIYGIVSDYINEYNSLPSEAALTISINNLDSINEEEFKNINAYVADNLTKPVDYEHDWLVDETEKFCQYKAIFNAITDSIDIVENKPDSKGQLPEILSDALAVSFDTSVGHDYIQDSEDRYAKYLEVEERIPFDLEIFNKITNGGVAKKSLLLLIGGTGTGKTRMKCHMAAANLMDGKDVLYLTMEMAEERIAERIDANLLNIPVNSIKDIGVKAFTSKFDKLKEKTTGQLIIKEYPTASASAIHFRNLLNELRRKRKFIPDIIYVDYLNICASARYKNFDNSYAVIKGVAEELRGLAVEFNLPIITSAQVNRSGNNNSDLEMDHVSESFGISMTADAMFGLITTEELTARNQIMVKQLKNRWGDLDYYKRFVVGVDAPKFKLYDVDDDAQEGITDAGHTEEDDDKPVFDTSIYGSRADEDEKMGWSTKNIGRKDFHQFS